MFSRSKKYFVLRDKEKLLALLSLTSNRRAALIKKPSSEQLEKFEQGLLSAEESEKVFAFLDENPESYQEWLSRTPKQRSQLAVVKESIQSSFEHLFNGLQLGAAAAVVGIASVVIAVMIVLPNMSKTSLPNQIATGYGQLSKDMALKAMESYSSSDAFDAEKRYGFTSDAEASRESIEFAHGVVLGRKQLEAIISGQNVEIAESTAEYTLLGSWSTLLISAIVTPDSLSPSFWQEQKSILSELQTHFKSSRQQDELTLKHLQRLEDILDQNAQAFSARSTSRLVNELQRFRLQIMGST